MKVQIAKDALQRVLLGQAFAEYDLIRKDPSVFVATPASLAATDQQSSKRIFVGRRGAGKTAIGYHLERNYRRVIKIEPTVFDLIDLPLEEENFVDTRQRPFKSLVCAFERAIFGEVIRAWIKARIWKFDAFTPDAINKERGLIDGCDFDVRVLNLHREILDAHRGPSAKLWLRQIKRAEQLKDEMNEIRENANFDFAIIIDRLDEAWDGSESAVICLMALMHACIRIGAASECVKPFLFVRENIYQRIRAIDNEFSRIETAAVLLDWTREKLVEMISRRLVRHLSTKPPLEEAWDLFFDSTEIDSKNYTTDLCQDRPRDMLTFVAFAQEIAVSAGHARIMTQDLFRATERFSTSKLKDLADEFDENYHNIQLVLQLFYGLSTTYTVAAIENFIERLLTDPRVTEHCKAWLFDNSTPHQFIVLLYEIGFLGIGNGTDWIYKSGGRERSSSRPVIALTSIIKVHPAYHSALHLQDILLPRITDDVILQSNGILEELPDGVSFDAYKGHLASMYDGLSAIKPGKQGARIYEDFIGEMIKLCFFRSLSNIKPRVRDVHGSEIRDWMASNRAKDGFWQMMRERYTTTQVVWECKNYEELTADDFHQACYYIQGNSKLVLIAFRGSEIKSSYIEHVKKSIKNVDGMILLLMEKDIKTFIRQGMNGKVKEDHITEIHDRMERAIG